MKDSQYDLLLLDLDGTLVGNDGRISPRVAGAVRTVSERIHTSIATGREMEDVLRFAGELGLRAPQISDNGAMVLEPTGGRCLWSAPLPPHQAGEVLRRLDDAGTRFIATDPSGTITSVDDAEGRPLNRASALDLDERAADDLVADYDSVAELDAVKVFLPYNGLWAVDFTGVGVNKATAALKVAEFLGVASGQMIAAGDSYNDLPLLQASALGIAMGDAPEELKSMADYVAPTVEEDGLAVAIEEFILPRLD